MSADNWIVCPKCKISADKKREESIASVTSYYGKWEPQTWLEAKQKAEQPISLSETYREDYGQGMMDDGQFFVHYSGRCSQCGFGHTFKHEEQVLKPGEGA
jgi:hypothetical protein